MKQGARLTPQQSEIVRQALSAFAATGNRAAAENGGSFFDDGSPVDFGTLLLVGRALEAQGETEAAIAVYDKASYINPGEGEPFTRRTLLQMRKRFGAPPVPRPVPEGRPVVSMITLGRNGRFGNQLLQYAALRLYAEAVGAVAVAPDWIGRDLFGLDDPLPPAEVSLAQIEEDAAAAVIVGQVSEPAAGVDLLGYFCPAISRCGDRRAQIRSFFEPVPSLRELVETCEFRIRARGKTVVALHLRRGDFDGDRFWIAPVACYLDWLKGIWPTLEHPVLYIASDDPSARAAFGAFSPLALEDLMSPPAGLEFFFDHAMLRRAEIVACSPSTFSITACQLNSAVRCVMMPDRREERLIEWSPWISS